MRAPGFSARSRLGARGDISKSDDALHAGGVHLLSHTWLMTETPVGDRFNAPGAAWPQGLRPVLDMDSWRFWCSYGLGV
eukprot:7110256-Prymnesium_polylepis.2